MTKIKKQLIRPFQLLFKKLGGGLLVALGFVITLATVFAFQAISTSPGTAGFQSGELPLFGDGDAGNGIFDQSTDSLEAISDAIRTNDGGSTGVAMGTFYSVGGDPYYCTSREVDVDGKMSEESINLYRLCDSTNTKYCFSNGGCTSSAHLLAVNSGENHSCAVVSDGTVRCWGLNNAGQLGDGTIIGRPRPVSVSGISTAVAVAGGYNYSCALLSSGAIKCWGSNASGQLGNGTTTQSLTPVFVSGISTAIAVANGTYHSCAVLSNGTVKCWGMNSYGSLGNGTTSSIGIHTPVSVLGISTAIAVTAGSSHTCALLSDGTMKCWGSNTYGELGDGTTSSTGIPTPVFVSGISTAVAIANGGYHSCAVLSDGVVKCWGHNNNAQLGNGTDIDSSIPLPVSNISTATAATGGLWSSCALLVDGTVECWGFHDGTSERDYIPVKIAYLSTVIAVTKGIYHACALLSDNMMKCWGYNNYNQLGDGGATYSSTTPVSVKF